MSDAAEIVRLNLLLQQKDAEIDRLNKLIYGPTVYITSQNEILVDWPDDKVDQCIMSRDLLSSIVAELNATRKLREQ